MSVLDELEERHRKERRRLEERVELMAKTTRDELDVLDAKLQRALRRIKELEQAVWRLGTALYRCTQCGVVDARTPSELAPANHFLCLVCMGEMARVPNTAKDSTDDHDRS